MEKKISELTPGAAFVAAVQVPGSIGTETFRFTGQQILDFALAGVELGGDTDGPLNNTTVVGLRGLPIGLTVPTAGQALVWDGFNWSPATLVAGAAGSSGQVQFNSGGAFGTDALLNWDNTNKRLGVGVAAPTARLHVRGRNTADETTSFIVENADGLSTIWTTNGGTFNIGRNPGNRWQFSTSGVSFTNGTSVQAVSFTLGPTSFPVSPVGIGVSVDGSVLHQFVIGGTTTANDSTRGGLLVGRGYAPVGGSGTFESVTIAPIINQTGGANGPIYGLRYKPILTAIAGAHYAATFASGRVGIGTETPTDLLDISGENGYQQLRLRTPYTPTSSSDANGNTGDVAWDSNYIYVRVGSGWKRSALSTF